MNGISSIMPHPAEKTEALRPRQTEQEAQSPSREPERDEYTPGEAPEYTGRYWMERDENGSSRIRLDAPERPDPAPEKAAADGDSPDGPEAPDKEQEKSVTCNTDRVDREIERLKKEQEELKQQLSRETDEKRSKELEKRLS